MSFCNQKAAGLVLSQGTQFGCGFDSELGMYGRQPIDVSLSLSLLLSLSNQ